MFFAQVEKLCKQRSTTPTAVTQELGYSKGSMSHWKKGNSPNGEIIVRFADYFGVSTDYLLGREEKNTNEKENEKMDDKTLIENTKFDRFKRLFRDAYLQAKKAHDCFFKESANRTNELIAGLYLNKAESLMSAAKAVYISNFDNFESSDVEIIFERFNIFSREALTSIETNHSHQWTDIEYRAYVDALGFFDIYEKEEEIPLSEKVGDAI